jgi:peptidoglycan/LPS O-acetylase OafA/YrhL
VHAHSIDLQMLFSVSWQQNFYYLQNFGAIGVDIFFVISGFIITFIAHKYTGFNSGAEFLVKRFIRINPIYYFASILFLIPYILRQESIQTQRLLSQLSDTILILPIENRSQDYIPLLMVGWTLGFEWLFYLIFITLIFLRVRRKSLSLFIIITSLVILGRVFLFQDYRLSFVTNPIMLEFLSGVIICRVYLHFKISKSMAYFLVLSGISAYLYSIFFGFGEVSEAGYTLSGELSLPRFFLWGIPSSALVAGCVFLEKNHLHLRLWNNRSGLLLGDASYSIYLIHLTIFGILNILYGKIGFLLNPDLCVFLQMSIAAIAGILFYKALEKPILNELKNFIFKSAVRPY